MEIYITLNIWGAIIGFICVVVAVFGMVSLISWISKKDTRPLKAFPGNVEEKVTNKEKTTHSREKSLEANDTTDMDQKVSKVTSPEPIIPLSVNYHFTRQCNYSCGFCFHTAKTSFCMPMEEAKKGLRLLKEKGRLTS